MQHKNQDKSYLSFDDEFYAQELFEENKLYGYFCKNIKKSDKSIYEYVVYDSGVEEEFAERFE